ncbi:MAG: thioredoxin family protein [Desulfobulbales bacterium]|nr:thioredoxin family protein [Desulfobulbales bacterium]
MAEVNDAPVQRQIRIGRATVGLVGFDIAVNRLLAEPDLDPEEAVGRLYETVAGQNYIPPGMEEEYREALAREFDRLKGGRAAEGGGDLVIRVLGPGCVSCNNLQSVVIEAMSVMGIGADVFQVHDPDEIGRYGITRTPALLINGEVKCSGKLPTSSQVEEWLREAIDAQAGPKSARRQS